MPGSPGIETANIESSPSNPCDKYLPGVDSLDHRKGKAMSSNLTRPETDRVLNEDDASGERKANPHAAKNVSSAR